MKYKLNYLILLALLITFAPATAAQSACSQNGTGADVSLSIPNLTDQRLNVYLVDQQCNEQLVGAVRSGNIFFQNTKDGHEWVLRDTSGGLVAEFTASVNNPTVPVGVTSYNPEPVTSSCSNSNSNDTLDLTVINNTDEPVLLLWIAFDCSEVLYEVVASQDQFVQNTYIGHDWVIRYPGGRVGKHINVSTSENVVVIDPPPGSTTGGTNSGSGNTTETNDASFPVTVSGCVIAPVTADMGLDAFYAKYCDYNGLVIASSALVDDAALHQAWLTLANAFYTRADLVESIAGLGFKIVVISPAELTTDVPELAYLADEADYDVDQDRRYDKVFEEPRLAMIGQENLLCSPVDPNRGQNQLLASVGNLARTALILDLDDTYNGRITAARESALASGIWNGSWITESNGNYWNYGVQTYFNASFDGLLTGAEDDYTNTRAELASYDPQLYSLIDELFNTEDWTPVCPGDAPVTASTNTDTTTIEATAVPTEEIATIEPEASFPVTVSGCEVAPVTADMGLDAFYAKYCDYNGLVIASSALVDDTALHQAWLILANAFYTRADLVESIAGLGFKIVVISPAELTTDVPELAYLADEADYDVDQDRRYDKVFEEPRLAMIGQENLVCSPNDSNRGQSLLLASVANLARTALILDLDDTYNGRITAARESALASGIWDGSWITDSNGNYWNYGVQTYFNASFDGLLTGAEDDYTNTRAELASYDPQLYSLIDELFRSRTGLRSAPRNKVATGGVPMCTPRTATSVCPYAARSTGTCS